MKDVVLFSDTTLISDQSVRTEELSCKRNRLKLVKYINLCTCLIIAANFTQKFHCLTARECLQNMSGSDHQQVDLKFGYRFHWFHSVSVPLALVYFEVALFIMQRYLTTDTLYDTHCAGGGC